MVEIADLVRLDLYLESAGFVTGETIPSMAAQSAGHLASVAEPVRAHSCADDGPRK